MTLPSAFAQQPVANDAALHLVAFGAGERRIVDAERHGQRRRIDRLRRQRLGHFRRAQRVRDEGFRQAGDGDDVAGEAFLDRRPLQAAEGQHLGDAALFDQFAVAVEDFDRLVGLHRAGRDAAGDDAAEIGIGFEDRSEHAERALLDLRRRDVAEHEIEQRRHALVLGAVLGRGHPALLGGTVEDREIELLLGGVERGEQVEHRIGDFGGAGVGAVDLVDDDDGLQPHLEGLGDHEFGLRQRPLGGVDQHQRAVHHVEDALDLAAEIGVAGGIDDVDPGVLPNQRSRLGEDGDAALALEVVRIHRALDDALILAKRARLLQQAVDQRGFAMVDVGDDGDIAQVHNRYPGIKGGPQGAMGPAIASRI